MGTNNIKSGGQRFQYEKIIRHYGHGSPPLAYDIALIRVRGKITLNDTVKPIYLDTNIVPAGTQVQAFGWGALYVNSILIQFFKL